MKNLDWRQVIRPKDNRHYLKHTSGDTDDIIKVIMFADRQSGDFIIRAGVEKMRGATVRETCKNVFRFVKDNLKYRADTPGHEKVKSPGALFSIGKGDCKSYSIAIGALLRSLSIPFVYRFTAYRRGDFTHVYIVAKPAGSRAVILDAVHGVFDDEVAFVRKKDIAPDKVKIEGVWGDGANVAGFVVGAMVFFLLLKKFEK